MQDSDLFIRMISSKALKDNGLDTAAVLLEQDRFLGERLAGWCKAQSQEKCLEHLRAFFSSDREWPFEDNLEEFASSMVVATHFHEYTPLEDRIALVADASSCLHAAIQSNSHTGNAIGAHFKGKKVLLDLDDHLTCARATVVNLAEVNDLLQRIQEYSKVTNFLAGDMTRIGTMQQLFTSLCSALKLPGVIKESCTLHLAIL